MSAGVRGRGVGRGGAGVLNREQWVGGGMGGEREIEMMINEEKGNGSRVLMRS